MRHRDGDDTFRDVLDEALEHPPALDFVLRSLVLVVDWLETQGQAELADKLAESLDRPVGAYLGWLRS